jgi:hypothetical protein
MVLRSVFPAAHQSAEPLQRTKRRRIRLDNKSSSEIHAKRKNRRTSQNHSKMTMFFVVAAAAALGIMHSDALDIRLTAFDRQCFFLNASAGDRATCACQQ